MKLLKKLLNEYLMLNLFIFGCISLFSLVIYNFTPLDPFTEAFQDFSLTDLYYSKEKDRNEIYKGPIVLVNIEDKSRKELAFLLQQIQTGKPKVVALDVVFAERENDDDSILQKTLASNNNYIFSYIADFDQPAETIFNNPFFTQQKDGYATLAVKNIEYSTARNYFPFNNQQPAFTSAIIRKYDPTLYKQLRKRNNQPTEIHYAGNLSNFTYFNFDEILSPDFDASVLNQKIVLLGYLGLPKLTGNNQHDEDKFFTPLNNRLSGRSYPDMYGSVIHANILRMILENNFIKVIPTWLVFIISFFIIWLILPIICGLFFKGDLWFNSIGTLVQLIGSIIIVFISVYTYKLFNTKFDPGLLTAALVLLPTLINLYEALLMFLKHKLKLPIHSAFLDKNPND